MYIRFFALLLAIQSVFSCRLGPENALAMASATRLSSNLNPAAQPSKSACAAGNEVVFQSIDGGATWHDVSAGLAATEGVQPGFALHNGQIFVCAEQGLFSGSPRDGGLSWQMDMLLGDRISGLYASPNYLYALKYEGGLFRSIAGTEVWESLDKNLPDKSVRSLVEMPDGALLVACDNGIYKSADGGATWKHVFSKETVWSLRMRAGVLVGLSERGVLRSTDGGDNWNWFRQDNGEYKIAECLDNRVVVLVKEEPGAINKLPDFVPGCQQEATNWTLLFPDEVQTPACGASAARSTQCAPACQSAQKAPACGEIKIDWAVLQAGLSGFKFIHQLERSGAYLFCSHKGGISRSADQGKTWELVFAAPDKQSVLRLNVQGEALYVVKTIGC